MKKPSIPAIYVQDQTVAAILRPIKENVEILNGQRTGSIDGLSSSATLTEVINKLNEVIDRLNP